MFKNISLYAFFSFIPFVSLGLVTVILLSAGIIPLFYLWFTLFMWIFVCGLGVAVGYHRVFSHKTHSLPVWKENILLLAGTLSGQGSSITWVAIHRGYHHRHTDTVGDIHTPMLGIWYAFFGWTLKITENSNIINMKYSVDLMRKPNHVWFHKNQMRILWSFPFLASLYDWRFALCAFFLPTAICLLQDNLVNVLGHKKALIGYRNFETNDQSHNNIVLGYLGWGQGWHNSHHYAPASYDFGSGISGKWWEYDPCRLFLPLLGKENRHE